MMDKLTLTKEQRKAEGIGYAKYFAPELCQKIDEKLADYEDRELMPDQITTLQAEITELREKNGGNIIALTRHQMLALDGGTWVWDNRKVTRKTHKKTLWLEDIEEPRGWRQIAFVEENKTNPYGNEIRFEEGEWEPFKAHTFFMNQPESALAELTRGTEK